jgi:hypothetical protein
MFAGLTLGRLLLKFWYVPVIAAMLLGLWVQHKDVKLARFQAEQAGVALKQAEAVNKSNTKALRDMQIDQQIDRIATERAIAVAQARHTKNEQAKQELKNAPGANDPAPVYFDAVGDKLRVLQSPSGR